MDHDYRHGIEIPLGRNLGVVFTVVPIMLFYLSMSLSVLQLVLITHLIFFSLSICAESSTGIADNDDYAVIF